MLKQCSLIGIIMLTGCGKDSQEVSVDPELAPYFQEYAQSIGLSTGGISAQFVNSINGDTPLEEIVGECVFFDDGTKIINIDASYWATINEDQKEDVLFHELTHCVMGVGHTPGNITTGQMAGCPVSLMNPQVFGSLIDCFSNNKKYYYQQLQSLEPKQ